MKRNDMLIKGRGKRKREGQPMKEEPQTKVKR